MILKKNAITAHREIKTKKQTVLKSFSTFSAICQGKLLVGMNHIAIKVFPTILLNKSKILPAFL